MTAKRFSSSVDINTIIAEVASAIQALLKDGLPRNKRAIVATLADRHPRDEVVRTLMRLAATDRVVEVGGKYCRPGGTGST